MPNMPYVTISLSDDAKELLEKLCKKEHRGKSNMVVHMMQEYIKTIERK